MRLPYHGIWYEIAIPRYGMTFGITLPRYGITLPYHGMGWYDYGMEWPLGWKNIRLDTIPYAITHR
jgi:hypothetical protein